MEVKLFNLKFSDGSRYKGGFKKESNELFYKFGILLKNEEINLLFEDSNILDFIGISI